MFPAHQLRFKAQKGPNQLPEHPHPCPYPADQIMLQAWGETKNVPHKVSIRDCKSNAAALPAVSKDGL